MVDRPIIFSAPMVRALLEGRKTQTRRVLKLPKWAREIDDVDCRRVDMIDRSTGCVATWYPPYAPGDRLYVREAFVTGFDIDDEMGRPVGDKKVWYRATDAGLRWYDPDTESTLDNPPWKPSIHMPRWASRLTLTVTDVRVQRLQDISEEDAVAEGCVAYKFPGPWWQGYKDFGDGDLIHQQALGDSPPDWMIEPRRMKDSTHLNRSAVDAFRGLWKSLHGPDAWDANPWVVALTFTAQHGNIDQIGRTP